MSPAAEGPETVRPRQLKTCHLGAPADVLDMLTWQFEDLAATDREQLRAIDYKTMQCAVTAWQLSDWVFEDLPAQLRAEWQIKARTAGPDLASFQTWVRSRSSALRICYVIANAFKHRTLRKDSEPGITSDTMNRLSESLQLTSRRIFTHEGFVLDPVDVMSEAVAFWATRLGEAGLLVRSRESVRFASLEADPSGWGGQSENVRDGS